MYIALCLTITDYSENALYTHYACFLYHTKYKFYLITVYFSVYLELDMGYIMQYLCYIINKIDKLYTMYDVLFYTFIFSLSQLYVIYLIMYTQYILCMVIHVLDIINYRLR